MRDIQAEKTIEKRLMLTFDLDLSKLDVTVHHKECVFSGRFVIRQTQQEADDQIVRDIRRFFVPGRIPGVESYFYELRSGAQAGV